MCRFGLSQVALGQLVVVWLAIWAVLSYTTTTTGEENTHQYRVVIIIMIILLLSLLISYCKHILALDDTYDSTEKIYIIIACYSFHKCIIIIV